MSRRIIFARTAVAALAVVALAPTAASARGFGGGHGSFGHSSFQRSFGRGRRSGTSTTPPRSGSTMAMIISPTNVLL